MKALSLTAPWGTFVADRVKRYETRSWKTSYRGMIAIHSSKGFPGWAKDLCLDDPYFVEALTPHGIQTRRDLAEKLPLGAIIAVATVVDIWRTEDVRDRLSARERAFGDYSDHRFAWLFDNARWLPEPIPYRGALGLFDVPAELEEA